MENMPGLAAPARVGVGPFPDKVVSCRVLRQMTDVEAVRKAGLRPRGVGRAVRLLSILTCLWALSLFATTADARTVAPVLTAEKDSEETIVFFRHGEKPPGGFGQLNCQGLNRALALPSVLVRKFGAPEFLFAPNPSHQIDDQGRRFDYIRPLATIEPTAVAFGLPVNTQWGLQQIGQLRRALLEPRYAHARIYVAWEHFLLAKLVRQLVAAGGADPAAVPEWRPEDFDSIYVVTLRRSHGTLVASFNLEHEGLNGQSTVCPS